MLRSIYLFLIVFCYSFSAFANPNNIKKIIISGNQRIESSTVEEYAGIKVGVTYSQNLKNEIINKLYATESFTDVIISFENSTLYITVKENQLVSKIVFQGNSKIRASVLTNEIFTKAGDSLSQTNLKLDIQKIQEMYKRSGRYSSKIAAKTESLENNRVKIIFQIDEGPKAGIKTIYFNGNKNYSDSELRSMIATKESRWFRFLESNDTYDPDRIEFDKQLLTQFYNSVGFADFRVISVTADLLPTKEGFILTYSIEEGSKYKFATLTLQNKIGDIKSDIIEKLLPKLEGKTFNYNLLNKTSDKISSYLANNGYPQVNVYPDLKLNSEAKTVDAVIVIDEALKAFIGSINITGNLKTEDSVIRRQFKIAEGDTFNRSKVAKGEQNIRNLDYFDKLAVQIQPTKSPDIYDINVDLEEKATSSITLQLSYSGTGGPAAQIGFAERNLVGTGKYLNIGAQAGEKNTYYYAGITDPYFLGRDLSAGVTVFQSNVGKGSGFQRKVKQKFSKNSTGSKFSMGYPITDDLSHSVEYAIKRDVLEIPGANFTKSELSTLRSAGSLDYQNLSKELFDKVQNSNSASIFVREQLGKFITSSIAHTITYDQLDSTVIPKNGYITSVTQEYAGVGGDVKHLKHEGDLTVYKSFIDNKYTVKVGVSAGNIVGLEKQNIRISNRFNLGDYSLRGFESIGPKDSRTKETLGGQNFYSASAELTFPVGLPEEFGVKGAVFADAGSLWKADTKFLSRDNIKDSKSIRASYGFAVIWHTRLAPIRMDWGFPFKKESFDQTQRFHIRLSTQF